MDGVERAHYSPPWANTSIIGIAGSSGSGKTSVAMRILSLMNLPWVVILSMDSFYKVLDAEQTALAHKNEFDFDSPNAIDFDLLLQCLKDIKAGRRTDIPRYSFEKHQREEQCTSIYSPHVLILEGIFALCDERILELLDMKIFCQADPDVCLARRILRDVRERGRDIDGCIKQWLRYVKPNYERYVEPQRKVADVIVPRSIDNTVAIDMIVNAARTMLKEKSRQHQDSLRRLGQSVLAEEDADINGDVVDPTSGLPSPNQTPSRVRLLKTTNTHQINGIWTRLLDSQTESVDFIFNFDRLSTILIERALEDHCYAPLAVETPQNKEYTGLRASGHISAVVILRGGSCLETGLKRVIPECKTGRMLIQSSYRTGEPELHYLSLPEDISQHESVLLLDPQMSSGGAALMAVRVLLDHAVKEESIIFVTVSAGHMGLRRLVKVFPLVRVVLSDITEDGLERWMEKRYFGC